MYSIKFSRTLIAISVLISLAGCASAPNWQHTSINDKAAAARQLTIDDGNCTLISMGVAPVPTMPAPQSGLATNVSGNISTYNTATGQRTYGTYTGQATSAPSGGFAGGVASGFANGANIGAVINAQMAQDRIHNSCMYSKGWVDANIPTDASPIAKSATPPTANTTTAVKAPINPAKIYKSAQAEWDADADEFMSFFPAYRESEYFERFNQRVKVIAMSQPNFNGPQYLLEAMKQLVDEDKAAPPPLTDNGKLRLLYMMSVENDSKAQSGLGLAYIQEKDARTPKNPTRAAYWSRRAAVAGNPVGQLGYGILLFNGNGIEQDHINGYLWVMKASQAGLDASTTLRGFESMMTNAELQAVK